MPNFPQVDTTAKETTVWTVENVHEIFFKFVQLIKRHEFAYIFIHNHSRKSKICSLWNIFFDLLEIYVLVNWTKYILETATEQIGHDKQKNLMMHNFLPNHSVRWKVFVILWYNDFYWSFCSILLIFFIFKVILLRLCNFQLFWNVFTYFNFSSFTCRCGRLLSEVTYLLHVRSCI